MRGRNRRHTRCSPNHLPSRRVKWRRQNIKLIPGPAILHLQPYRWELGRLGSTHSDGNTVPQTVIGCPLSGSAFSYSLQSVGIQRLIRASRTQAATISSCSGEKSVLDTFPSSLLDLTALLFRLGVMIVGKEGLGFFGYNPSSQFFLHHPVLCLQPGRLVRPLSACINSYSRYRQTLAVLRMLRRASHTQLQEEHFLGLIRKTIL